MKRFLCSLIILCFVLAGVSPACKFISGQSWAEICGADGSVKLMPIPEELAAFQPGAKDQPPVDENHQDMPDCAFCFAQTHFNGMQADAVSLSAIDFADSHQSDPGKVFSYEAVLLYEARGPPVFSS
jgi:hypothetical protein